MSEVVLKEYLHGNGKKLFYTEEQFETLQKVKVLFKNEKGMPMELTPQQCELFNAVFKRKHSLNHVMNHTRWGKSMVLGLAVLLRIATFPEKWSIVAPSSEKARIIMDYIIQHAFDNEYIKSKLEIEKGESLESLRRKRTKDRINFKHSDGTIGEVFIIGVDSSNKIKAGEAVMGFGASNVILDEAALVDDEMEGKVFRMLADNADDYFYMKIGNPFTRGHFLKSYRDPKYWKMNMTYKEGIAEGRLNQDYIDIAKSKPNFDILFENKFPAADMVDRDGWTPLLTDEELEGAMVDELIPMFGQKRIGLDVAEGGNNFNSYVLRGENIALVLRKDQETNLMMTVGNATQILRKLDIPYTELYIDAIGVGSGVADRFLEQRMNVRRIKVSNSALDSASFYNLRAESYWRVRDWIKAGGKLKKHPDWWQLTQVRYKVRDSSGTLIMMSKDEMRKKGIESPDTADALMLTFAFPKSMAVQAQIKKRAKKIVRQIDGSGDGYALKMGGY
jgi:hypothetical protein